jgi:hypothetical protein
MLVWISRRLIVGIRIAKAVEELLRNARRQVKASPNPTPNDTEILRHILAAIHLIRKEHDPQFK